ILQAVAYEFRSKPSNVFGIRVFDGFLFLNGCLGPFLIGVAVGTFFTGSNFSLDLYNRVTWGTNWHGLEALANPANLALGLAVLFLARILGLLYLVNTIDDAELSERSHKSVLVNTIPFLVFFLSFVAFLLTGKGFQVDVATGNITTVKYFYLHSLITSPLKLALLLAGVVLVLYGISLSIIRRSARAVWYVGTGTVAVGLGLFFLAGYGKSAFYPSVTNLQSSLTLAKASSSRFTLQTMMYVSFIIPFVFAYIWIAWKAINRKRITGEEMAEGEHTY
ncbi:MAG TPA: cytochrome d ubiquinol oxidase subunit II, partial [Bacteroidales bacterium]|nr:cytochrome d ubiquinol oxidase subunit II [Bacteroidales bacterium]